MEEYKVSELALNLAVLEGLCTDLRVSDQTGGKPVEADYLNRVSHAMSGVAAACRKLGTSDIFLVQVEILAKDLASPSADRRPAVLHAKIGMVLQGVAQALSARKFFLLSEEEASFYGKGDAFGPQFKERYSVNALRDAISAGNCYAAGEYTACVFHCMRVAEHGLRKLAANSFLRVKIQHKGKSCPIEYGEWQKVIEAIRSKIAKIRQRPVGPKREADLQFFSSAADHCEYMKDIWRNEVSHTRRWYKKEEALNTVNRVREFVTLVGDHKGSLPADDSLLRFVASSVDSLRKEYLAPEIHLVDRS